MAKSDKEKPVGSGELTKPRLPADASVDGYETFDGDEAQRYSAVGGHLVSITPRYPSKDPKIPAFKPGKRYRFVETKTQLDTLAAQAGEG